MWKDVTLKGCYTDLQANQFFFFLHFVCFLYSGITVCGGPSQFEPRTRLKQVSKQLILSYRLIELTNSYVLHYFWITKHCSYLQMGFGLKCSILNRQVIFIGKSNLKILDMWLISPDCVTFFVCIPTYTLHVHQYVIWIVPVNCIQYD